MAGNGNFGGIKKKKKNGLDSFFFNRNLTLHQETPHSILFQLQSPLLWQMDHALASSPHHHPCSSVRCTAFQQPQCHVSSFSSHQLQTHLLHNDISYALKRSFCDNAGLSTLMSHSIAFPHVAATLNIVDQPSRPFPLCP